MQSLCHKLAEKPFQMALSAYQKEEGLHNLGGQKSSGFVSGVGVSCSLQGGVMQQALSGY